MSKDYIDFVNSVDDASRNHIDFLDSLMILQSRAVPSRLLTGVGTKWEASEFSEIVKKCIFQGKEYDDAKNKLKDELSDV